MVVDVYLMLGESPNIGSDTLIANNVAVNSSGQWSVDTANWNEGNYTIYVVATDDAGNISGPMDVTNFTIDAKPAAPILTFPADGSTDVSTSLTVRWANNEYTTANVVYYKTAVLGTYTEAYNGPAIESANLPTLSRGTAYLWYVRSATDYGVADSTEFGFSTAR